MWQTIICLFAVDHQRFANNVEIFIGTNAGKLRGPIVARIDTEGFVIVPIKCIHNVYPKAWAIGRVYQNMRFILLVSRV